MNNQYKELLIETRKLKKFFPLKKKHIFQRKIYYVRANEDVTLTIYKGETLGIVGESGCGKSTLGRVILQLVEPTSGSALYYGIPLRELNPKYIIKEIKKLPKYQAKAIKAYVNSVEADEFIKELQEKIKLLDNPQRKQEIAEQEKVFDAKIAEYNHDLQSNLQNSLSYLKQSANEFEMEIVNKPYKYVSPTWKEDVERVAKLIESCEENALDYIILLPFPSRKIVKAYKNTMKIRKAIQKLETKKAGLSISKEEKLVKKLEFKSKELKKEASRQLREGSRTAGEFILESNIKEISDLMLAEELKHREVFGKEQEVKSLQKKIARNEKLLAKGGLEEEKRKQLQKHNEEANNRIGVLQEEISQCKKQQEELLKELKKYHFNKPLPITERTLDPEYQQKMEGNREYAINLQKLNKHEIRHLRKKLQIIFQDPYSSLDPRMTVGQAISEAVVEHGLFERNTQELEDYIVDIMAKCGLDHYMIHRYPHQFSGGQRQRIVIARALALQPEFVVCDESVSALDVSIQSQILNLLADLKKDRNLTYLFISHDLSVIKHISDRIGVMYLGNLVELTDADTLYENPLHPYSKALISAIPTTSQEKSERIILEGDIPSNIFPPSGCKFRTRCPLAREKCAKVKPELVEVEPGHSVACHFYEETKTII